MKIKSVAPSNEPFQGWLHERFGDCQAQLSVRSVMKLRSAVKDVARAVMGFVPPEIEKLTKNFENAPINANDLDFVMGWEDAEGFHQGSLERDEALQSYVARYPEQWEIVKMSLSLPRQLGRHASAFVLASKPISDFIPLTTVSGEKVTAFSGAEVEAVGGLKVDLLVVKAINDIQCALELIRSRHAVVGTLDSVPAHKLVMDPVSNKPVDIWDLPSCNEVYEDISFGRTDTVFQFSTHAAKKWLQLFRFKRANGSPALSSIGNLAAFTALDRPGPLNFMLSNPEDPTIKHNLMVEYSRKVRGLRGSQDILPVFDSLLPDTFSLIIFQEQLQKIFQSLTGCTGAEAEEFRSVAAKKKMDKIAKASEFFVEKATPKIGKEKAEQVFEGMRGFASYCFNESHAVAYCVISYACAWLKHHYPQEWFCAVLGNAKKGDVEEKFWPIVKDMVLLPDLNKSADKWTIEGNLLRAPVSLCYGIGEAATKQLVDYAPYSSAEDFCKKIVEHRVKTAESADVLGKSAITIGTLYTLMVAGIADSIFDPNTSIAERLAEYHKWMKKYTNEAGFKYAKTSTDYPSPDGLGRYQLRKDVLPEYYEDFRCHIKVEKNISEDDEAKYFSYQEWDRFNHEYIKRKERIIDPDEFFMVKECVNAPRFGYKVPVPAYVNSKESFSYLGGAKTAKKLFLDVYGETVEAVMWPADDGGFPKEMDSIQAGSIIIAVLRITDPNKGFALVKVEEIREPFKKAKKAVDKKLKA